MFKEKSPREQLQSYKPLASEETNVSSQYDYTAMTTAPVALPQFSREHTLTIGDELSREDTKTFTLDVVQWTAPIFYVEPSEKVLSIDVMRIGHNEGTIAVSYRTVLSETSHFSEYSGRLEFADREDSKTVSMRLPTFDHWSTTSEFKIKLFDESDCQLATYLHTCRVKVIRTETFPSPVFDGIAPADLKNVGSWYLYFQVVWMLFWVPNITWRTIASVIIAQSHNLYLFMTLIANKYMVDVVFDSSRKMDEELWMHTGPHRGRNETLLIVAALYIVPMPFLHLAKVVQCKLDLKNNLLAFLRVHLLNQFLNYSESSRSAVGDSRFLSAINDEVTKACESYEMLFEILKLFGKMMVLVAFVIREDPSALITSSTMPIALILFAVFRSEVVAAACRVLTQKNVIALRVIQETLMKYDLIAQYQVRPRMLDIFRFADNEAGDAALELELVCLNNKGFATFLGPLFNAYTIAVHGPEVLEGNLSLGTFLATISVYREFSELYGEIYACFMGILGTLGTTKDVTMCFNMPLDLLWRKDVNRMRRRRMKDARAALLQTDAQNGPQRLVRTDRVNLEIVDLCWYYTGKVILHNVNMVIPQGGIIGISGPHGSGKATLMQLLAGIKLPEGGSVFIPSHLRALYVPEETLLLALSAWANLIFGFPSAHPSRVKDILLGLGMNSTLQLVREDLRALGRLEEMDIELTADYRPGAVAQTDELAGAHYGIEEPTWHHALTNSEKSNFAVARALITNPEVLIFQRPLSALEPDDKNRILTALEENITNKGYKLPKETVRYRRPRTLFVSSSSYLELNFCNSIWLLDLETGGIYKSEVKKYDSRQRRTASR